MKKTIVNILIILMLVIFIISGCLLIEKGKKDFKVAHNKITTKDDNKEVNNSKTLAELEEELIIVKETINLKNNEFSTQLEEKKVECDKFSQIKTKEFFKEPNSDAYYEANRNHSKCIKEDAELTKRIWELENSFPMSTNDEVKELVESRLLIENKIENIKNPRPTMPKSLFEKKEFNWAKLLAIGEILIGSIIVLIPTLGGVITNNKIVKSKNKVDNTFANIDVYLKKRWDLIPNIVESVKGYTKHESDTLTKVTEARKEKDYNALNINEKISLDNEISTGINNILLLQENYPELKADKSYLELSTQLTIIEDQIANSRIKFNNAVMNYNNLIKIFPNNLLVRFLKHKEINMFNISKQEKENTKIKL